MKSLGSPQALRSGAERGIVGPFEGSKPRSVSLTRDQWAEMQLRMKG